MSTHTPQNKANQQGSRSSSKSPKQKIFGVMSKRRWFGVWIFLSIITWSYSFGPPLKDAYIANQYFKNPHGYKLESWRLEGDMSLIGSLFFAPVTYSTFFWQVGAHFEKAAGMGWAKDHLFFSDAGYNWLFTYSKYTGIQLALNGDELRNTETLGVAAHQNISDIVYLSLSKANRIVKYNVTSKQKKLIADNIKTPKEMIFSSNEKWLYFIDENGIHRIDMEDNTEGKNKVTSLITNIPNPHGLAFSPDHKTLYVTSCVAGEAHWYVYKSKEKEGNFVFEKEWTDKNVLPKNWNGSLIGNKEKQGCTNGIAVHPITGHIISICPSHKLCILNPNGQLSGLLHVVPGMEGFRGLKIGGDYNLYITTDTTLWFIKMKPPHLLN